MENKAKRLLEISNTKYVWRENIWNDEEYKQHLHAWFHHLCQENEALKRCPEWGVCAGIAARVFTMLALAADAAGLPPEAKYLALDLYRRFIVKHIDDMTEYVWSVDQVNGHDSRVSCSCSKTVHVKSPSRPDQDDSCARKLTLGNTGSKRDQKADTAASTSFASKRFKTQNVKTKCRGSGSRAEQPGTRSGGGSGHQSMLDTRKTGRVGGHTSPGMRGEELLLRIMGRLEEQTPLRVLTCLQIATKMLSHSKILSSEVLRSLLHILGHDYSGRAVKRSELRVLRQLRCRCSFPSSYLVYVGLIVALLGEAVSQSLSNEDPHGAPKTDEATNSSTEERIFDSPWAFRYSKTDDVTLLKRLLKDETNADAPSVSCYGCDGNGREGNKRDRNGRDGNRSDGNRRGGNRRDRDLRDGYERDDIRRDNDGRDGRSPHRSAASQTECTLTEASLLSSLLPRLGEVREAAVLLLDACLLRHDRLYAALLYRLTGSSVLPPKHRPSFTLVVNDRVLLCAGLVLAGCRTVAGERAAEVAVPLLVAQTAVPATDITTMMNAVVSVVMKAPHENT